MTFAEYFNNQENFFNIEFCEQHKDCIITLLFTNNQRIKQELVNRFPRRVYGFNMDNEQSELQRCLYHLPEQFTTQLKFELEKEILKIPHYSGNLVFLFFRYLDLFAFQTKLPSVFFGKRLLQEMDRFNYIVGHFMKVFHYQKKMRDLLPMYRDNGKSDLKKKSIANFTIINKSYQEIFNFQSYIFSKKQFDAPETKLFMENCSKIFYFIIFNYNKSGELCQQSMKIYHNFVFNNKI